MPSEIVVNCGFCIMFASHNLVIFNKILLKVIVWSLVCCRRLGKHEGTFLNKKVEGGEQDSILSPKLWCPCLPVENHCAQRNSNLMRIRGYRDIEIL